MATIQFIPANLFYYAICQRPLVILSQEIEIDTPDNVWTISDTDIADMLSTMLQSE
jgi:hypothetical protein